MIKRIVVTQACIDKGHKFNGNACPVARAMHKVGMRSIHVTRTHVLMGKYKIFLPKRASNFIGKFDFGMPVKPFEFNIDVPGKEQAHD